MGHGIAQVPAQAGYDVVVREVDEGPSRRASGRSRSSSRARSRRARPSRPTPTPCAARIHGTTDYKDLADCDLVIEAITEDLESKLEMWRELDEIVKADALFATNTSSLPVIAQAAVTDRARAVPRPALLQPRAGDEARRGHPLRDDLRRDVRSRRGLRRALGKLGVQTRDNAGFIVNRLLVPYLLDAHARLRGGRRLDRRRSTRR